MLNRRRFLYGAALLPFVATPAAAGSPCVFEHQGIAINGIDPVSYFTQGEPVPGTDRFRLGWRNAVWRFASSPAMEAFERDPHRFAPRYGGFCAMAMVQGGVSETLPEAWAVHKGRLYLAESMHAIEAWKTDPDRHVTQADSHWSTSMCR